MAWTETEFLIVGGGIAGLSVAAALAERGEGWGVRLLDREPLMGTYASGNNAGIGRQLTGRAEHTALTREGAERLASLGLLDPRGGCLLAVEPEALEPLAAEAQAFGLPVLRGTGSPVPGLKAGAHLMVPSDGVIDVDRVLGHCADTARRGGAALAYGTACGAIHPGSEGFEVETPAGGIRARHLILAAGAWCQPLGRAAGGLDLPLAPLRRHLIWSPSPRPAHHPWTWWVDRPLYLRPESGGVLMCACEEDPVSPPGPGLPVPSEAAVLEALAGSVRELVPDLSEAPIARLWCGLRTFAPDRTFVLGQDPLQPRLYWAAGLGGHGITSGLAVGRLLADLLLGRQGPGPLDPARFLVRKAHGGAGNLR